MTHVINIRNAKIVNVSQFKEANRDKLEQVKEKIEEKGKLACARKFNRVLLPLDFSECSREAVELVEEIGHPLEEIILLAVVESSESREELEKLKADAGDKLTEIKKKLSETGAANRISHRVEDGAASENILTAAQMDNVGLIILSKRGRGRIREMLLGSTADRVAKESPVPVLLIPCQK